jgi:hypothetical protein
MPSTKKPQSKRRRTSIKEAKLVRENKDLKRERDESLERETATSEILRMIAKAPGDLHTVLNAIAERPAQLCDAADAAIYRVNGDYYRFAAHFGPIPMSHTAEDRVIGRDTVLGRTIADRQTIHVPDLQTAEAEFPGAKTRGIAMGLSVRCSPHRYFVKELPLVLFISADERCVLSQTDQPVLDAIVESAARVCGIDDVVLRLREGDTWGTAGSFWFHTNPQH